MKHILMCEECNTYSLSEKCPKCGAKCDNTQPPKYSPHDPNGRARRIAKKSEN